jgi:alkanesulfonate monooxygenase SsuD/methylene tetrahydromethanopterin reductase-like flavin-dependent oxidoreductase (luciferase family)
VGGHARASLRRAAEIGAAWHPINRSAEEIRTACGELQQLSRARGRTTPPAVTLRNDAFVLRPGQTVPAPVHGGSVVAGEPEAMAERIRELGAAGVEHLVLEFLAPDGTDLDEQMTLFAERVRPRLV